MGRPNFFVVGAAKSGTTALYHALREHPDVYLPATKEPHFYAYLADRSKTRHLYDDETSARRSYRELYADVTNETAVGDSSTTNLVVSGAAAAIAQDVPDARIVAVLRHPVDRAFSHWCHFLAAGGEEIRDFAEALCQEQARREAGFPFTYEYLGWGSYATQLQPFYECFGRERVLVHLYDDLRTDASAVVRDTLDFIGVDGSGAAASVARHNEMPVPRFPAMQRALARRGRAGRVMARWAAANLTRRLTLDPALRAELTAQLGDDISRLETLIDRDLSAWR
jgi:hypothetical protein